MRVEVMIRKQCEDEDENEVKIRVRCEDADEGEGKDQGAM